MLATAPDPRVTIAQPVYYRYGYDYWQQLPNGSIALGGSRDRYPDQEWGHDAGPTATVQAAMEATLRTVVKSTAPVTHRWAASVGYRLDDVRPLVQEITPRLWVCGGYSGTGNLVGAICAQRIAQAIVYQSRVPLRYWMD
jgi:glycine/D-amino acid oxidase-like deaminating enzyme